MTNVLKNIKTYGEHYNKADITRKVEKYCDKANLIAEVEKYHNTSMNDDQIIDEIAMPIIEQIGFDLEVAHEVEHEFHVHGGKH